MREFYTDIHIDASAEEVWRVLTDFAAYPDWNPFLRRVDGEARLDARLHVFVQLSKDKSMSFRSTVLVAERNRELRWHGQHSWPGVFEVVRSFLIEPLGEGHVLLVHRERFRGLLVPFYFMIRDRDTRRGFEEMNRALKLRAESAG